MRRIFTIIMIAAAVLFTSNNMSAYNSNSSENYVEQEEVDDSQEDGHESGSGGPDWRKGYAMKKTEVGGNVSWNVDISFGWPNLINVTISYGQTNDIIYCCMESKYVDNMCNFSDEETRCKYVDRSKDRE